MGYEKSAPHIKTILIVAGISVVTLGLLEQGFRSYYNEMFESEEARKVLTVPTTQLNQLRENEQQHLTSGKMPLDKAMRELGQRGRGNPSLAELGTDITPVQSTDPVPMWGLLVKDGGAAPAPAPGATPAPVADDAGAAMMGDAAAIGDAQSTSSSLDAAHALTVSGDASAVRASTPTPIVTEAGAH